MNLFGGRGAKLPTFQVREPARWPGEEIDGYAPIDVGGAGEPATDIELHVPPPPNRNCRCTVAPVRQMKIRPHPLLKPSSGGEIDLGELRAAIDEAVKKAADVARREMSRRIRGPEAGALREHVAPIDTGRLRRSFREDRA